jgi:rSAM/selenodomain-associated transferase 1
MRAVGVLARVPVAPRCKTRLHARLSPLAAAELAEAMTRDAFAAVDVAGFDRCFVFATGGDDEDASAVEALAALAPASWIVRAQAPGDLGARMEAAFVAMFEAGATRAALLGTDAPGAPVGELRDALAGLESGVLLGPTDDGGYWTIAMTRVESAVLRDLPWSSDRLASATRARCADRALPVTEIARAFDVDEPADVDRLAAALEVDASMAPITAAWLRDHAASWRERPSG